MSTMSDVVQLRAGYTVADLASMPDDGHRYELIDGVLVVTPSPAVMHQRVVGNLYLLLRTLARPEVEVMLAPLDVTLSANTVVEPDLLVAPRTTLTGETMVGLPILAVEVLSPSTRLVDLNVKKAAYERAGIPHYWTVDPREPSLQAWGLTTDGYRELAHASGSEPVHLDEPFEIEIIPAELTR